jgi:hypothetical protein
MYIAIIGDLIKSREIKDRADVQLKLKRTLEFINKEYASMIASDFMITLGDEFQGVLTNGSTLLEMIDRIKFEMKPVEIRFGIGIGEIVTEIDRSQSLRADGSAYWHAREAIDFVRDDNDYETSKVFIIGEKETQCLKVVNESLRMCDYLESKWRDSQIEFMRLMIRNYGYNTNIKQKSISEQIQMSSQMVNKKIQNTGYHNFIRLKSEISRMVELERGEAHG